MKLHEIAAVGAGAFAGVWLLCVLGLHVLDLPRRLAADAALVLVVVGTYSALLAVGCGAAAAVLWSVDRLGRRPG